MYRSVVQKIVSAQASVGMWLATLHHKNLIAIETRALSLIRYRFSPMLHKEWTEIHHHHYNHHHQILTLDLPILELWGRIKLTTVVMFFKCSQVTIITQGNSKVFTKLGLVIM